VVEIIKRSKTESAPVDPLEELAETQTFEMNTEDTSEVEKTGE